MEPLTCVTVRVRFQLELHLCLGAGCDCILFAPSFEHIVEMWTELRHSGILDDVARRQSLSSFLGTLDFVSTCWSFSFPDHPHPSVPDAEVQSIHHLAHFDMIVEGIILARITLQIPSAAFANTRDMIVNKFELHICRMSAYLLICFVRRLIVQDNGFIPAFFEVLHLYKTSIFCSPHLQNNGIHRPYALAFLIWRISYRTRGISNSLVCTLGCHLGLHPTMLERLTRTCFTANTPGVAHICNWLDAITRFSILLFIMFSVWAQESKWQYALRPFLNAPWAQDRLS